MYKEPNGKFRNKEYNNQNLKNTMNELNRIMEMTKERMSGLENKTIEITQSGQQGENRLKKNE